MHRMNALAKIIIVLGIALLLTGCGDGMDGKQYHAKEFKDNAEKLGWDCTMTTHRSDDGNKGLCEYDKGEFHCIAQVYAFYDELRIEGRPQCVSRRTERDAKPLKDDENSDR
jgi:hypothetical protein